MPTRVTPPTSRFRGCTDKPVPRVYRPAVRRACKLRGRLGYSRAPGMSGERGPTDLGQTGRRAFFRRSGEKSSAGADLKVVHHRLKNFAVLHLYALPM